MASTTIRISKDDKKELNELITFLSFKAKRKLTQKDILSLLISLGKNKKLKLVDNLVKENESKNTIKNIENDPFFNLPEFDMDADTSENVDKIIYGK